MFAYMPKATVQAAIGSVPLAAGLSCGQIVLSVAVLAIVITAPLGALGMDATYKKLLEKEHLNFQNHVLVSAQDIDELVALMCYLQISLLGVAGYVKVGNSLTDPITSDDTLENYWFTPMYFSDIWETRRTIQRIRSVMGADYGFHV